MTDALTTAVADASPVDALTDHAVSRIGDIHAMFGRGEGAMTREDIRLAISNVAWMMLRDAGMSPIEIAAAMRDRYGFN